MAKKILKVLGLLGISISLLLLGLWVAFQVSVKPGVFVIRHLFNQPIAINNKEMFEQQSLHVDSIKDIIYPSNYPKNTMDIYFPKNKTQIKGVLVWVNGGGFVAGDKSAMREFATYIVAGTELAVVAINYQVAPDLTFPGQVHQLDEAIAYLTSKSWEGFSIDYSNLFIGGDSAGGQIAGQYLALQTNPLYAKELQLPPRIPTKNLSGFISYCAPVDLKQVSSQRTDNLFLKFFVSTVARAVLGTKDWRGDPRLVQASVVEHLSPEFPATFISDGNAYSFPHQGIAFSNRLQELHVPVSSLFFQDVNKEIVHEYQFNFNTEEALLCLNKTIDFLNSQSENRSKQ